jgi:hypothetical protein
MAQVAGGSDFDGEWEERTNVCLGLLREAADRIASHGFEALRADVIVDALLWVLASRLPPVMFQPGKPRLPLRFFEGDALPKPAAMDSCGRLRAGDPKPEDAETVAVLVGIIESSARSWADGDPEIPETREVLRQLLGVLWSKHLARHPPSKTYPRGI